METTMESNITRVNYLAKVVQELSLARDLEAVMQIVRKAARQLTGADGATFVLRDGDLCFYAEEDAIAPLWKGRRFPMESCISGWSMLHKEAVVIEDIYKDARISHEAYRTTFVKSLAMVPIRTVDPIGAIGNYWSEMYTPTQEQLSLLQALADITAVSLENIGVYSELEQRVKKRTEELEYANKELESFSYSVSHDLRAPLRAINGYMTIFMEDYAAGLNEDAKKIADKVMRNSHQMGLLIEDLLAFFKMGKKELSKKAISIDLMVKDICKLLQEENKPRVIEFEIGALPDALADQVLMRQVIMNLLSNAVKYTGNKEKALIVIGSQKQDEQTVYYVKDNGAGFDMAYSVKLFGVFQRLHSQKEFEGNGIGLAIVEKIISRHGGKIWADARQNVGATFYFSLG
jgi:K+-sensing histidine kinase KdpD